MNPDYHRVEWAEAGDRAAASFTYAPRGLLLALIPCAVGILFGLELALLRMVFPKQGPFALRLLGLVALAGGVGGLFLVVRKWRNPKPFLIVGERGLYVNVLVGTSRYFFLPWEEVLEVRGAEERVGPVDTSESALLRQASYSSILAVRLPDHVPQPKVMVQSTDLGDGWLGFQIGMLDHPAPRVVAAVREAWGGRRGA
jgi:hypothetical protein